VHVSVEPDVGTDSGKLEGRYANYFQVGHNAFEFVLEFGQLYRDGEAPALHTRIIANPAYAKQFLQVLGDALHAYERSFGEVADSEARSDAAVRGDVS
jgi:hypothetical protein